MSYNKLFESIITSTIWGESHATRIVWVTMLASADKNGEVMASIPGLARIAVVTPEEARAAIDLFLGPDPDSRTPDDGGRRIEAIPGGWRLLNYKKYRAMASKEELKETEAKRKAAWRKRENDNGRTDEMSPKCPEMSRNVPDMSHDVPKKLHIAEAEAEAEADKNEEKNLCPPLTGEDGGAFLYGETKSPSLPTPDPVAVIQKIWDMFPPMSKNRSSMAKLCRAIRKLRPKPAMADLIAGIAPWTQTEAWSTDGGKYVSGVHTWIADRKWETPPAAILAKSKQSGTTSMVMAGDEF